ncbi:hypothetical protein PPN31114_02514 [Pandoraea pneumonica]|jgi:hypothetical protein|uniref:Uncharacterized protein n=1 Tax=Pandoraea pneumonica TaxID=2508299 RepID=A0A5E4V8H8_9BURK|nr:hypothetical protein PPN31114_02514 [Pandoraea pneumonica]
MRRARQPIDSLTPLAIHAARAGEISDSATIRLAGLRIALWFSFGSLVTG